MQGFPAVLLQLQLEKFHALVVDFFTWRYNWEGHGAIVGQGCSLLGDLEAILGNKIQLKAWFRYKLRSVTGKSA